LELADYEQKRKEASFQKYMEEQKTIQAREEKKEK